MSKTTERILIVAMAALFLFFAMNKPSRAEDFAVSPAQHVNIWGLNPRPEFIPLFGPVVSITDGGGFERMQIDTTGSIVFRHAATIQFADTTVHAGHIRGFVYIRMVDGSQALMPVFALPGDTTDYGVTIDP